MIYYKYEDNLSASTKPLAERISDTIKTYKIEQERKIHQARMLLGPYEFEVLMNHGNKRNFTLHTSTEGRTSYENEIQKIHGEDYAKGVFERHVQAVASLCRIGLLGLNTSTAKKEGKIEKDDLPRIDTNFHERNRLQVVEKELYRQKARRNFG